LENGAPANEDCENSTLIHLVLTIPLNRVPSKVPAVESVLRTLLERGAKFDSRDMDFCARKKGGACAENLLPILQEFDKRRESL
jgi:hypothetical protein